MMQKELRMISLITLIGLEISVSAQQITNKPNVIFIMADDIGYGDLSCYGASKIHTPNIDKLANEGCMFTDAHSASAVCTPSRYALLTGQYPFRANNGEGVWGPLKRNNKLIINPKDLTIGSLMQKQGYETACIGKWHLGFGDTTPTDWNQPLRPGPNQLGFSYYFGVPFVNSGPPYVYVENDQVMGFDANDPLVLNGNPITQTPIFPAKSPNNFSGGKEAHAIYNDEETGILLANKAVDWIKLQQKKPFFLYLATTNIHHPFTPNAKFKGKSNCGKYGDFVDELDWIVGQISIVLEELDLADNTLLIFTSDNGGMLNVGGQEAWQAGHRMNGQLLGFKFDAWEGGHRIPFIARWPGKIKANTKSDQLVSNIDMLATLAALTGYELKGNEAPDSYNLLPALLGNPTQMIRDQLVLSPFQPQNLSLRMGDWMYIGGKGGGGWSKGKPGDHIFGGPAALQFTNEQNSDIENGSFKTDAPNEQLYNLKEDLSQKNNLILAKPEIAEMMRSTLRLIQKTNRTRNN